MSARMAPASRLNRPTLPLALVSPLSSPRAKTDLIIYSICIFHSLLHLPHARSCHSWCAILKTRRKQRAILTSSQHRNCYEETTDISAVMAHFPASFYLVSQNQRNARRADVVIFSYKNSRRHKTNIFSCVCKQRLYLQLYLLHVIVQSL